MSELNDSLREELIQNKDDKGYRHGYADENLNATIATQIKVLREQRDWKQEDLANEAGMKQPMISRYENVNYSSWSINTLKKLAEAFDVYLDVRFRSFRELVDVVDNFSREFLQLPKFTDDPYFFEAVEETAKSESIAPVGLSRLVGQVSETDIAQPITASKANPIGQAIEKDTAQSILLGALTRSAAQADLTNPMQDQDQLLKALHSPTRRAA